MGVFTWKPAQWQWQPIGSNTIHSFRCRCRSQCERAYNRCRHHDWAVCPLMTMETGTRHYHITLIMDYTRVALRTGNGIIHSKKWLHIGPMVSCVNVWPSKDSNTDQLH